ncbi:MAG TPA: AAA family ATPase [Streptosporangiaceae bacterium]|nr:AAA family ATPase [Streptosporangiaceae bacterium]
MAIEKLRPGISARPERQWLGSPGSPLFGREAEIAVLDQFVARIPEQGGALVLRGDPGIGKTTLLTAASAVASSNGVSVLRTAGAQSETGLAFAGLHQLLRPVLTWLDRLPGPQRDALSAAFGAIDVPAPDPFLIALAALNLLAFAADRVPLLLVVDEAQWLDPPTAAALAFIARRVDAEPIAVLFALRNGADSTLDRAGLPELRLGGLDDAAASKLMDTSAVDLTPGLRRRVLEIAAGNPLALLELPDALRLDDAQIDGLPPGTMSLTSRLECAFAQQVSGLPAQTRDLLLLAAADERASAAELLAAASSLRGAKVRLDAFAPAEGAGLAGIADGSVIFRHPLVRSAIYQSAGAVRRSQAHAALAAVLPGEPDRRLWHVAASTVGPDESVARKVELLSARLARRGAIGLAVAAARRAAVLSPDSSRRCSRWLRAGELAFETGDPDLLRRLVREAEQLNPDGEQRARLTWLRSTFADAVPGDQGQAQSLADAAEVAADAENSDLALHLLFGAAVRCWRSDLGEQIRDRVAVAVEGLRVPETHPRRVVILAMAGPVRWGLVVSERLAAIEASADELSADEAYLAGMAARAIGDHRVAARFLGSATAQLRGQGRLGVLVQVLVMGAWVAIAQGSWASAEMLVDESARLAEEVGQSWWRTGSLIARGTLRGLRGEAEAAERLVAEAEKTAISQGLNDLICMIAFARAVTWLGAGRPEGALEHVTRVFDRNDPAFHEAARFMSITYLADAAALSGQRDVAAPILGELETLAQRTPSPTLHGGLVYAHAVLAPDKEAERLYEVALRSDLRHHPFDQARLQLAYGAWLRRHRRVSESRAPLRAARQVFDALGCAPWGERAGQELRASGEKSPGRVPAARDQLSTQELQIAQMAASGMTNREIGQQLYLSPRTVGSHLYRLFPKLGITSRSQLTGALDVAGEPPAT